MNVLFDFGAIKTGGGVQLSVNFLSLFDRLKPSDMNIFLLIPEVGALSKLPLVGKYPGVFTSPNSFRKRFVFEHVDLQRAIRRHRIQYLFTFFGAGLPHPEDVRSVVTVAYPIICYPESPYWRYVDRKQKTYMRCLNVLRRWRLRRASAIIAETTVMRTRLARSIPFPADRISVIPPVPSRYVTPVDSSHMLPRRRFLFISGNDSHKNLWRLPAIAHNMLAMGARDFKFLLTTSREAYIRSLKESGVREELINAHFTFLGGIPPQQIMEAYGQADVVVSLSDLESFSNNYMEAWTAKLPLIVSDRDFTRSICGESAIYVEPHQPAGAAQQFCRLLEDRALQDKLIKTGLEKLSLLPTQEERFALVMKQILGER